MTNSDRSATSGLLRLGGVFSRRRWVWLPFVIVTPLVVYFSTRSDPPSYSASAQVLLNRQNQLYAGVGDPTAWEPERAMDTQLVLAGLPILGHRVAERLGLRRDGEAVAGNTSVDPLEDTDILVFTTTDPSRAMARRIATAYAQEYVRFRREFDTATIGQTLSGIDAELRRLERAGRADTALYREVQSRRRQLATASELQEDNALVVRSADDALRVTPRWRSAVVEALVAALIVGLGLAYVIDARDWRLRSPEALADAFGLPLLATVRVPRRLVSRRRKTIVARTVPEPEAEAFRQLRRNLAMHLAGRPRSVVMVTTTTPTGSKDAVSALLGLALARAGEQVAIADLDLGKPTLHRLFGVTSGPGLTDVLLEDDRLDDVARPIATRVQTTKKLVSLGGGREQPEPGSLEIITTGVVPVDAPDALGWARLGELVDPLRKRAEIVLLEAPPLLTSSDAPLLARECDAIVLVAPLTRVTTGTAREVVKLLGQIETPVIGVVVTDAGKRHAGRLATSERRVVARPA